jgi:hypothetical protein
MAAESEFSKLLVLEPAILTTCIPKVHLTVILPFLCLAGGKFPGGFSPKFCMNSLVLPSAAVIISNMQIVYCLDALLLKSDWSHMYETN